MTQHHVPREVNTLEHWCESLKCHKVSSLISPWVMHQEAPVIYI